MPQNKNGESKDSPCQLKTRLKDLKLGFDWRLCDLYLPELLP